MSLTIYSQNLKGGFSFEESFHATLNTARSLTPDVLVYPEAYNVDQDRYVDDVHYELDKMGYYVAIAPYTDEDRRLDQRGMIAATRKEITPDKGLPTVVRIAGRNMVEATVELEDSAKLVSVYGVHLDDRSEARRVDQASQLLGLLAPVTRHAILVGDFNSIPNGEAKSIKFLAANAISKLVQYGVVPATEPESVDPANTIGRLGSKGKRLHEMASGATIDMFLENNMQLADRDCAPTFPASKPFAALDHIVMSERLYASNFQTLRGVESADHLAISATVDLR